MKSGGQKHKRKESLGTRLGWGRGGDRNREGDGVRCRVWDGDGTRCGDRVRDGDEGVKGPWFRGWWCRVTIGDKSLDDGVNLRLLGMWRVSGCIGVGRGLPVVRTQSLFNTHPDKFLFLQKVSVGFRGEKNGRETVGEGEEFEYLRWLQFNFLSDPCRFFHLLKFNWDERVWNLFIPGTLLLLRGRVFFWQMFPLTGDLSSRQTLWYMSPDLSIVMFEHILLYFTYTSNERFQTYETCRTSTSFVSCEPQSVWTQIQGRSGRTKPLSPSNDLERNGIWRENILPLIMTIRIFQWNCLFY